MNCFRTIALITFVSGAALLRADAPEEIPSLQPLDFSPVNISGDGSVVIGTSFRRGSGRIWFEGDDCSESLKSTIQNGVDGCLHISSVRAYGISRFTSGSGWIAGEIDLCDDCYDGLAFVYGNSLCSDMELRLLKNYDCNTQWAAAYDVTDDGSMAVGEDYFETGDSRGYRALWWTDTTDSGLRPTVLQPLADATGAWANAMDAAGTRAVGASYVANGCNEITQAVYWDLKGDSPMAVSLGALVTGGQSEANDISRNGAYIVGWADTADGSAPFISYLGGPMSQIMAADSSYSQHGEALGVSNNGTTVGYFDANSDLRLCYDSLAFVASPAWGVKTVNQWLQETGATVSEDLHYDTATAISEDGKVIVGMAEGSGYIARAGSGSIDAAGFYNTLGGSGSVTQQSYNVLNMTLHGAHHIPLQMMKGVSRHFWFTGDAGRWDRYNSNSYLSEVGGAVDLFDKQLLVGVGVGQNWVSQTLALGGKTLLNGQYYLMELSYKPTNLPLVFTLTGAMGNWDAKIDRNYFNAGNIDTSTGRPHINSNTLRFSVHWLDVVKVAGFGITPKIEYTANNMQMGGYAEQGGGFPAYFNQQNHTATELRYGLSAARLFFAEKLQIRLRSEWVHRFDQTAVTTSGQTIGLFNFNVPGQRIKQDWVQFGGDMVYSINDRTNLTASVTTATAGQDPVIGGSVGVQVKF
ncbi:autotransporter domain-containing protein [Prosthecobacter fluviatilis]|uniref:Autotransporter domain-containing protein n=1 Tax=Prosthecobacter fluviatilis TaxID=445931 RepID=A0ABW0KP07_9BACT